MNDLTKNQLEKFHNIWRHEVDKALITRMHNWGGLVESEAIIETAKRKNYKPSYFPFSQKAIQYDGTVRLCCADMNESLPVGHIAADSLKEIWQDKQTTNIDVRSLKQMWMQCQIFVEAAAIQLKVLGPNRHIGDLRNQRVISIVRAHASKHR